MFKRSHKAAPVRDIWDEKKRLLQDPSVAIKFSAISFSKKLEALFTTCGYCGTRYTRAMIDKLESMSCVKCGGPLDECE